MYAVVCENKTTYRYKVGISTYMCVLGSRVCIVESETRSIRYCIVLLYVVSLLYNSERIGLYCCWTSPRVCRRRKRLDYCAQVGVARVPRAELPTCALSCEISSLLFFFRPAAGTRRSVNLLFLLVPQALL